MGTRFFWSRRSYSSFSKVLSCHRAHSLANTLYHWHYLPACSPSKACTSDQIKPCVEAGFTFYWSSTWPYLWISQIRAVFFNVSHFHLWLILSVSRKKRECPSLDLLEQNFARGSTKFGILKIWATKHILALKHCLLTFFNNHICSCPSDNRCAVSH